MTDTHDQAKELIKGGYEMHVHTAPSHFKRIVDDYKYAAQLDEYGMAGAVIKMHFGETAARVMLVNKYAGAAAKLFGSITLDWGCGGLCPAAVEASLLFDAKVIWMPTLHSQNSIDFFEGTGKKNPVEGHGGIRILDENDKLRPEVYDILDLAKQYDVAVATGHISYKESIAFCRESRARDIKTIVTHPDSGREHMPLEVQIELANLGCFIDKCWENVTSNWITPEKWVDYMKAIGPDKCIIITDYGQKSNPQPCEGMINAVEAALKHGVTPDQVKTMIVRNPKQMLGLS